MMHMNTPIPSQEKLFPEQKPIRVTVPVTPEVQAAFQRLAAASGMSTGRAMSEWLSDTMEGAVTMAEMLEKARRAPKQAVSEMHAYALGLADMTSDLMDNLRRRSGGGKTGAATGTVTRIGFCSENSFSCEGRGVFICIMLHQPASLCQHGAQLAPAQIKSRTTREAFKGVLRP